MTDDKALEKALALVQHLYVRTKEAGIVWKETGDERMFEARLGEFMLHLRQTIDRDYPDQPDYELRVISKHLGREVERITNRSLRPLMDRSTPEGLNPYDLLDRTYNLARRQALGADEALEAILQYLGEKQSA